ncbi:MAG: carboxypeptidase regulatory-like domain-containing protein, partial [Gemmatimonadales bacterium]
MSSLGRITSLGAALLVLATGAAADAGAQGVTSAAVRGTITREGGVGVEGAVVTMLNVAKGTRQRVATGPSGRYFFENVEPGGPYT